MRALLFILFISLFPSNSFAIDLADFPDLQVGAWQIIDEGNNTKSRICIDKKTTKTIFQTIPFEVLKMKDFCVSKYNLSHDVYISELECTMPMGIGKFKSITTFEGDFTNNFIAQSQIEFEKPPVGFKKNHNQFYKSHYVGKCRKGEKPGKLTKLPTN